MKFTGVNILYTPEMPQINYLFGNIVVNSTGLYSISSIENTPFSTGANYSGSLFKLSGNKILDTSGRFVSTYNTGETFSISGWLDYTNGYRYLSVGTMLSRNVELVPTSGLLNSINITCPTNSELTCELILTSSAINSYATFNDVNIQRTTTGTIYSTTPMYVRGGTMQFYQSYESLLSGEPLMAYVDTRYPTQVVYSDNDTSYSNNTIEFDYHYDTTYAEVITSFTIARTGLYNSGIYTFVGFDSDSNFSGLFDGYWSGSGFFYEDIASSISFDLYASLNDAAGGTYPKDITYNLTLNRTGQMLKAEYISGFSLTASGEYLSIPTILVTGYYYTTGIQQDIASLLFSSGCTGALSVTFSGDGTGASGLLNLTLISFSGVYDTGIRQFNTVSSYTTVNIGTGFTYAPVAYVNTGQYADCFDVPFASGFNYAWFRPFHTVGTIDVEAGWFTGIALTATGLVSGGLMTGYYVTGVDIYNIGTGYSNARPPLITFVRNDNPTGLISGASGNFIMNTGALFNSSTFTLRTGLAGTSLATGGFTGTMSLDEYEDYVAFQMDVSGFNITEVVSGNLNVSWETLDVDFPFAFAKYFDTGSDFLKKKVNEPIIYSVTSDLDFGLGQSELDLLYSSEGYVGNSWPFEEGSFDF